MKKLILGCLSLIVCLTIIFGSSAVNCDKVSAETATTAKNIILFIGDGMGPVHVEMAHNNIRKDLTMETLPNFGFSSTANSSGGTTDSSAGATAIACGIKVPNGLIGMKATGKEYQNIREYMVERGRKSGIITTSYVADATPACFGAHVQDRKEYTKILNQYLQNNIDVIMGGGLDNFGTDLLNTAKTTNGYTLAQDKNKMDSVTSGKLLGLFASSSLPYYADTKKEIPTLAEMTQKAIDILKKNFDGFFLMVEGAKIDHAATEGSISKTIDEVLELDKAVKVAWDFAQNDKNTLVIVTADHETGGLEENGTSYQFTNKGSNGTYAHTSADVPVYAGGVCSEMFKGDMKNTDICKRMKKAADSSYVIEEEVVTKEEKEANASYNSSEFDKYVDGSAYKKQETDDKNNSSETVSEEEKTEEIKKDNNDEEGKDYYTSAYKNKEKIRIIIIVVAGVFVVGVGVEAFFLIRYLKKRKKAVPITENSEEITDTETIDTDTKTE